MIDEVIRSLLSAIPVVNTEITKHIYPALVPERCKTNAIRYTVEDKPQELDAKGPDGYELSVLQIDVYHKKYSKNRQLTRAIHKELHGYIGNQGSTQINLIEFIDSDLIYEKKTDEYRTILTFNINYREI